MEAAKKPLEEVKFQVIQYLTNWIITNQIVQKVNMVKFLELSELYYEEMRGLLVGTMDLSIMSAASCLAKEAVGGDEILGNVVLN